jgi:DNA-binding CsgD family transcriptional regulator
VADPQPGASLDAPWPLVGRDGILARVTGALLARNARRIVLTGETGVGKSRIAYAATAAAEAAGDLVISMQANPVLSAVPFGVAGNLVPVGAPVDDPLALFTLVREHLLERAAGRRIVIDVHSAAIMDTVTTSLIGQLAAAKVITFVASIRTGDVLPGPLATGWSPDDSTRFEIPPLTKSEAGDLLHRALGGSVAWHVTDELHAASDGNPLYLRELVIGAVAADRLVVIAGTWQLTGDPVASLALRDLVSGHVRTLDGEARDVVERLAVVGELDVAHLPDASAALSGLEETGIVAIGSGRTGLTARLTQESYGAVVRDGLSMLRRATIAREHADLLERDGRPEDALRIALLRLDAGQQVADESLLAAAQAAAAARDHRTVERLTAAASALGTADPNLLLLRGTALSRLGRLPESISTLDAAAVRADTLGADPALVVGIALASAFARASVVDGTGPALAALDALPPELAQSPGVALVRSTMLLYEHRAGEARALLDAVVPAFAGSAFEQALLANSLAPALSAQGEDEPALAAIQSVLETAAAVGPAWPIPLATIEGTHAELLLQAGRHEEAFSAALRGLRIATSGGDEFITRYLEFTLGRIELERGRLAAAARWFQEVVGGALSRGPISLVAPAAGGLAMVRLSQGDDPGAREALALIPPGRHLFNPPAVLAAGMTAARTGDFAEAASILLGAAERAEATGYPALACWYFYTLARWGDPARGAEGLERLVAAGAGELTVLQARHARAEASGDRAELVAVGDDWERRGAKLYAAEALASAARLAQAAGESRAATGLQARSDTLVALTQGATTPLLRFTAALVPLTAREREIASLAARGTASKDIADRLFLSVRTVDNHLQSIYGKLGIRGRRELAAAIS